MLLNVLHVIILFLFMLLYFAIMNLETLALTAIT